MKLIHVSDMRLCSVPEAGRPWAAERQEEYWDTFREICRACNKQQVGLLLLSGNIFDREPDFEEMGRMEEILRTLMNTQVVWICGWRDSVQAPHSFVQYPWPSWVHILSGDGVQTVELPQISCAVTGVSYQAGQEEVLPEIPSAPEEETLQLLLLCGGEAPHMAFRHELLAAKGYDYVALGGKQNAAIWERERVAYAGSPEPHDAGGLGQHGYLLVDVTKKQAVIVQKDIAKRHYRNVALGVSREMTLNECRRVWLGTYGREPAGAIYRLTVRGQKPQGFPLQQLEELGPICEVCDETGRVQDLEAVKKEHADDIIGVFLESMEEEPEGALREKATALGISALLKGEGR